MPTATEARPPHLIRHSVVADALRVMRQAESTMMQFRTAANTVARALAYEATRDLPVEHVMIQTPLEATEASMLNSKVVAVPILRAGLWMLDGFLEIVPSASTGFIGLRRNEETLKPFEYYRNVPDIETAHLFLLDPMLATGGSICAALANLPIALAASVSVLSIIAAPEGLARIGAAFPDVQIHVAAIDRQLSDVGYILPGLGDAGDRLCGTA